MATPVSIATTSTNPTAAILSIVKKDIKPIIVSGHNLIKIKIMIEMTTEPAIQPATTFPIS